MYLGIDLGTSNSAIVGNVAGDLRLFKTSDGRDVLPSVLYVDRRGHRFVGSRAYDQALLAPQNVAQGFKRLMGTKTPIPLEASGEDVTPEEASAEILRTLVTQAHAEVGDFEVEGAVITVPAAFNQMQSEATVRAAASAGLERIGLLQEPIAAAMASLERSPNKDGQFLVYDLGGGTFDVALVQSIKGAVTILAHEGINMLGGRDFDKSILNAVIRPWLLEHYDLPDDFQKDKSFQRLIRIAQMKGEVAKIELSTRDSAVIFVSEEEARAVDRAGADIYLEVTLTRKALEDLIEDRLEESVALCRKVLADNGLTNDDIDRIVLIGGPSKMPAVRDRVPRQLGIAADLNTDPMTAVARGAAIYAESRVWKKQSSERKSNIGRKRTNGAIQVSYEYEARTSSTEARIKAVPSGGDCSGYRISALTSDGRDTGQKDLSSSPVLKVTLPQTGSNVIKMRVVDSSGAPVPEASTELVVTRVGASSAGIPATHTIAVKLLQGSAEQSRNTLKPLVNKGDLLPRTGVAPLRAAKTLKPGTGEYIDIELFQQTAGVMEPELNLFIGSTRIPAGILDEHQVLRRGDEIKVHWAVDDNGLFSCSVEIPSVGAHINDRRFYVDQLGHKNFDGENGSRIAGDSLVDAEADLDALEEALGEQAAGEIAALRRRHQRQLDASISCDDADGFRSIAEECRHIRQEASILRHSDAFRGRALNADLEQLIAIFSRIFDAADHSTLERVEQLTTTARRALAGQDFSTAERAIDDLNSVVFAALQQQPEFIIASYGHAAKGKHLAADPALHERLVAKGEVAIAAQDFEELREVLAQIYENRAEPESPRRDIAALAHLMPH